MPEAAKSPQSVHFNEMPPMLIGQDQAVSAYQQVRSTTDAFSEGLTAEDQNLQSMADVSPIKWHRAHTSWFFETFLLKPHLPDYRPYNDDFAYLFNSYYNSLGAQYPRAARALISRPDSAEVGRYRAHVDQAMLVLLSRADADAERARIMNLMILGLNHEQQHQELMVTDLKHAFSHNPIAPAIVDLNGQDGSERPLQWLHFEGGLAETGFDGDSFHFDNEGPRHQVFLAPFSLADRPVSCGEFADFIDDGGYQRAELWLSDGWAWIKEQSISHPLYWERQDHHWHIYTCGGRRSLDRSEPVCHLNFYEACAFAEWANARLPLEAEWEHASRLAGTPGILADDRRYHPDAPGRSDGQLAQMFGGVWEWTRSSYAPYTGFRPARGAVGEYNGKFMANQMVLRGGSCATPGGHIRPSYRNFFYPRDRWQFSGLRLARDGAAGRSA
ncbi:MAG: ergothioneine biosynthesis protein EgtB [Wenzhouxiangella sp.]|nr:ergothioneine biosynthesis protein EgtB [Wenzhouxiangella sp.]